jgi:hypothetical protein
MKRFQALLAIVVLLVKNDIVENSMNVIELWDASSAGNDVKQNRERIEANKHVRSDQHSSSSVVGHVVHVFG